MKREIALKLIEAVKAQKGPLAKGNYYAEGRYCVIGLLQKFIGHRDFHDDVIWAGLDRFEYGRLVDANDSQPKAKVIALIREIGK